MTPVSHWKLWPFRSASNGSNESLESISMCSEGLCESDRDMEIEEEEEEEEEVDHE